MSIICYQKKQGLLCFLNITCTKCGWVSDFCTSREIKSQGSGRNSYVKSMSEQLAMGFHEVDIDQKGLYRSEHSYLNWWTIRHMKILTANFILLTLKLLENQKQHMRLDNRLLLGLGNNFSNDPIANIKVSGDAAWQNVQGLPPWMALSLWYLVVK